MHTKILIPLDGSPLAEGILPYARAFAKALEIPVKLLHVLDANSIETLSDPRHGRYLDVIISEMKGIKIDYLHQVAQSFPAPSMVHYSVSVGKPVDVILEEAASDADSLIAMATHGRSGIKRWFLGTITDKVLQATTNHLLLVRPSEEDDRCKHAELKTILLPLDGSELAERAIPHVIDLAKIMKLGVILLRVYALPEQASDFHRVDWDDFMGRKREETSAWLKQKVQQLKREGVDGVTCTLLEGDEAENIIDVAQKTPDNLLVICSHGQSGSGRWALGSVANRVVHYSGERVLVIRASSQD